jgi:A/G-specific adenine glycosylase
MLPIAARDAILAWYGARGRVLPFRGTTDPYAVLVSEVMAQQTQIARVGERWSSFVARFPTLAALAAAAPADVLREWRGLGYNRRAVALWRLARAVVEQHGGELPSDPAALERLPGVGPYTARAVSAIAFGRPVGAVDTNVRRVLGRVVAGSRPLAFRELQALADRAVPKDRTADWTHAVMDVGATFCRARSPRCADCPARPWCRYAGGPGTLTAAPRTRRPRPEPFVGSTRWLRGRIVERLAATLDAGWTDLDESIGAHPPAAVAAALRALARDGLVDLDPAAPHRARLARS